MRTPPVRVGGVTTASGSPVPSTSRTVEARSASQPHDSSVLESRHPGLVRTLTLMWGHPELTDFLSRVAAGLEPRARDVDPAAMAELMLLGAIHRTICPPRSGATGDVHSVGRLTGTWRPAVIRG